MAEYMHPRLRLILDTNHAMFEVLGHAAAAGYVRSRRYLRGGRAGKARRPGAHSPLWNVFAVQLRRALRPRGAKARLARYLGVPRQRLTDFVSAKRRLPDAELTLRLVHWLAAHCAGRDLSS